MQCTNAGQVITRGGQVGGGGGNCVATPQAQVMRAVPILDEDGNLEVMSVVGQKYVKVYDPALGIERWEYMPPDTTSPYSKLLPKLGTISSWDQITDKQASNSIAATAFSSGIETSHHASPATSTPIEKEDSSSKPTEMGTSKTTMSSSGAGGITTCLITIATTILLTAGLLM